MYLGKHGANLSNFAIVETGGKQYKVQPGDTINVESLPGDTGDELELRNVLLVSKDGKISVEESKLKRAKVKVEIVGHGRNQKVTVFKYKAKTRYRKKAGHRQSPTTLKVNNILLR